MDYKQELITTIHDLGADVSRLESRLTELSQHHRTAVLIPSLYEELERPALATIREQLGQCTFVNSVVICLYAETFEQYVRAVEFLAPCPSPPLCCGKMAPALRAFCKPSRSRG